MSTKIFVFDKLLKRMKRKL